MKFKTEFFHIASIALCFLAVMLISTPAMAATAGTQELIINFEDEIVIPHQLSITAPSTATINLPRTVGDVESDIGNVVVETNDDFYYTVSVKTDSPNGIGTDGSGSLYTPIKIQNVNGEYSEFASNTDVQLFGCSIGGSQIVPVKIKVPVTQGDLDYGIKPYHTFLTYTISET